MSTTLVCSACPGGAAPLAPSSSSYPRRRGRRNRFFQQKRSARSRIFDAQLLLPASAAAKSSVVVSDDDASVTTTTTRRREAMMMLSSLTFAFPSPSSFAAELKGQVKDCENCSNSNTSLREGDKEFNTSESGLRYIDLREGDATKVPKKGDVVVVDWVGYTAGYQAKKIESTRETDTPFTFRVGSGEAIPAFDEAVLNMGKGGIKRIEIAGELEEKLGYSRNPNERYNGVGPKPTTFGGLRALDFVLDNKTLKDFNRTLLFDVKLVAIRSSS
jgi:FKBP-type peptidyl-prolyl cis-trans isomerase